MNESSVPITTDQSHAVLDSITASLASLTPEIRKAASYVLDNPNDVGVLTIREIADFAAVKPNTFVRLAQSLGYDGYEDFRTPFREAVRQGQVSFPDRARWLQSLGQSGQLGELYRDMVCSAIENIEETFAAIQASDLQAAAKRIVSARQVFTLGVGVNNANARNFTYLASTGMLQFHAIPQPGNTAVDDLAWANEHDVLIAITCKPYRAEVVEAVAIAREQGVTVVAVSDNASSPIVVGSQYRPQWPA